SVRRANRKQQWQRVTILIVPNELGELLGRKLLSLAIEQDQGVFDGTRLSAAEFQQSGFIFHGDACELGVSGHVLEIFRRRRVDGGVFGLADPSDLDLHSSDLTTSGDRQRKENRLAAEDTEDTDVYKGRT